MQNAAYWRQRAKILEESEHKKCDEYLRTLEPLYIDAQRTVQRDIESWYARFANDNGLTLTESRRLLNTKELEEFRWDVNKYIEAGKKYGTDTDWQKKLKNASAKFHVSRLEAIQMQIQQQIELLYGNQSDSITELLRGIAGDSYTQSAYTIQRGIGIGWDIIKLDEKKLDALLSKPWTTDNRTFSDRIWVQKTELLNSVQKELTQGLLRGDAPRKMTDAIAKRFSVSKYQAGRLVYTEGAYFNALSAKEAFKNLGVESVEVVETLDSHTCSVCGDMDGKVIPLAQYEPGVTVPPFHPNCRGCTCPHIADADGERIARNADGETYTVPADMTYREWEKKFIKDAGKADAISSIRGAGGSAGRLGETIHKYLGKIDTSNEEDVKALQSAFCKEYAASDVENMLVITKDGEVYFITDNNPKGVDCSYLGDKLKGSYNIHTHPPKSTQFTFSTDVDFPNVFADGTAVMEAVDYKYRYRFEMPEGLTWEQWDKARGEAADDVKHNAQNFGLTENNFEEDCLHKVIEKTCNILNIDAYKRWRSNKL